jgi:maltose-binding protein MalE
MRSKSRWFAVSAAVCASVLLFSAASRSKDEPVAQNTMTVWVDGKGQSGFAEKLNKMHGEMEAKGMKFVDMAVYVEDGDMQGAFVTYVR